MIEVSSTQATLIRIGIIIIGAVIFFIGLRMYINGKRKPRKKSIYATKQRAKTESLKHFVTRMDKEGTSIKNLWQFGLQSGRQRAEKKKQERERK